MTKISVGLVDDQPLVRTGFAMLINSQDDMETSWEASDGAEVPTQTHADIVLMDVQMPRSTASKPPAPCCVQMQTPK